MKKTYKVHTKVWIYPGDNATWHFVSVDKKQSADIKERYGKHAKGFRTMRVEVTLGETVWQTSLFPDSRSGMYILPLKATVRQAEGVFEGGNISFTVKVL